MNSSPIMTIFVSSVQKEFAEERKAIKAFVSGDPLLRRFFHVFLFEDLPAEDRRPDDAYLEKVERCNIYLGLFGDAYGSEGTDGLSPTEREFDRATGATRPRLVFIKASADADRHPKMISLIRKAEGQLTRRRFSSIPELTANLYASLVEHLMRSGAIQSGPFDASPCPSATIADISEEKIAAFLGRAQRARGYALGPDTPVRDALVHLNILINDMPAHAAILLFGKQPQRFLISSEVNCLHFHGAVIRKPIDSYQVYKGDLFELVDQAVDFVLGKLDRRVGTRAASNAAPVTYEIPREAVAEAIVNAVAHRDYASNASIQIMLFSDRLEVWNPGELPPSLTIASLSRPHASVPHNPLIAEPLFLTRLVERAGTGIIDMIALCKESGLKTPVFRQDAGSFVQTLWRPSVTISTAGQVTGAGQVTAQVKASHNALNDRLIEELSKALAMPIAQVTAQVTAQVVEILSVATVSPKTHEELLAAAGVKHREHFRKTYIDPLVKSGWIERTVPEKPTSRFQKYRTAENGRSWLERKTT